LYRTPRRRPRPAGIAESQRVELQSVDAELVRQLIETGLPGARVAVRGDDGVHFEADVVSEAFRGKLPLARHRMVYATLGERMGGAIHALSLRTLTPEENSSC
jgi:acid stress-induced BolA-like protein IbaG/YrbA